jgi:hypothetical protein
MSKSRLSKFKPTSQNPVIGGIFVALFAAIGVYLLTSSHAATPYISTSAGSGTVGCNASIQPDSSGNNYVKFGSGTSCSSGGGGGTGSMLVGLVDGTQYSEPVGAVSSVRYDVDQFGDGGIAKYAQQGIKVVVLFSGPYNSGGVSAITGSAPSYTGAAGWASSRLAEYQKYCTLSECPAIELLNEPTQGAFWGSGHNDPTDQQAYAALVKDTATTFHSALGSNSPLILASYDGGQDSSLAWGQGWWNSSFSSLVDGLTIHPYGGTSLSTVNPAPPAPLNNLVGSGLGNRYDVTTAHQNTGKPIYVTEVGWPTFNDPSAPTQSGATGDSIQWPLDNSNGGNRGDQCDNIYNFVTWARSTGFVGGVFIFGSTDYSGGSNAAYGVADPTGNNHKPSFAALKAAAASQSNPCANALTYPTGNTL